MVCLLLKEHQNYQYYRKNLFWKIFIFVVFLFNFHSSAAISELLEVGILLSMVIMANINTPVVDNNTVFTRKSAYAQKSAPL